MERAKKQIDIVVKEYRRLFPAEYKAFLKSNALRIDGLEGDNKFAEIKGSQQVIRHLTEVPETLYYALVRGLTDEELDWLFARNRFRNDFKGIKWFMETYQDFNVTKAF